MVDARTTARFPVDLPATVTSAEAEVECIVHNVSLGGVFVHGAFLPIDTRVVLRFTLPERADVEIACTARWSTPDGTGLQFNGLRAADTYALTRYIKSEGKPTSRIPISQIRAGLPSE